MKSPSWKNRCHACYGRTAWRSAVWQKLLVSLVVGSVAACSSPGSHATRSSGEQLSGDSGSACTMPSTRTTVREQDGALVEVWELPLGDVLTDALPDQQAFLEYREVIERAGAAVRRPIADPPLIENEEMAAVWRDEFFNNDLVFEEGVGSVDPISCLDALLFARQASRVSPLTNPTEFLASVLRRDTDTGANLLVVFGAGSEMFVPRDFYGLDLVREYVAEGWSYWYAIHNHTVQRNGDRPALGVPAPSTSDVRLMRSLGETHGLDSARVTNGFYTFNASIEELVRFRSR